LRSHLLVLGKSDLIAMVCYDSMLQLLHLLNHHVFMSMRFHGAHGLTPLSAGSCFSLIALYWPLQYGIPTEVIELWGVSMDKPLTHNTTSKSQLLLAVAAAFWYQFYAGLVICTPLVLAGSKVNGC
jgi:hypothetical protein